MTERDEGVRALAVPSVGLGMAGAVDRSEAPRTMTAVAPAREIPRTIPDPTLAQAGRDLSLKAMNEITRPTIAR